MMIKVGLLTSGSNNLSAPSRPAGETLAGLTAMQAVWPDTATGSWWIYSNTKLQLQNNEGRKRENHLNG
jgi:hypothetical protein